MHSRTYVGWMWDCDVPCSCIRSYSSATAGTGGGMVTILAVAGVGAMFSFFALVTCSMLRNCWWEGTQVSTYRTKKKWRLCSSFKTSWRFARNETVPWKMIKNLGRVPITKKFTSSSRASRGRKFQKKKKLYTAKKKFACRMCARQPTSAMPKPFLCCERAFCCSMVVMAVLIHEVACGVR